jgi:hypothetical protein
VEGEENEVNMHIALSQKESTSGLNGRYERTTWQNYDHHWLRENLTVLG